jgi:hypothetical protein
MSDNTLTVTEEVTMQEGKRNPIAKSFGAGINQPKVIPNKRRDRRVKHRNRWKEDNSCGAEPSE